MPDASSTGPISTAHPSKRRTTAPAVRMPLVPKGHRAHFFGDPAIDKVYTMLLALMGEVSVLRDRLDAHERLAAAGVVGTPDAVDGYVPAGQDEAERDLAREEYVRRIFRVLREEAERLRSGTDETWEETIASIRDDED